MDDTELVILYREKYTEGWRAICHAYKAKTGNGTSDSTLKVSLNLRISRIRKALAEKVGEEKASEALPKMKRGRNGNSLQDAVEFLAEIVTREDDPA